MAFKRLIATIFVKDGIVVKSYNFKFWRPAGHLRTALINLDRWAVDEILVVDISRNGRISRKILDEIKQSNISTPLIYGGGIRNIRDVKDLLAVGCDRFLLETLLFGHEKELEKILNMVGEQALIGSLPIAAKNKKYFAHFTSFDNSIINQGDSMLSFENMWKYYSTLPVSEVLIMDADNEGNVDKFSCAILNELSNFQLEEAQKKIIWFGGLGLKESRQLINEQKTVGVAYGNNNFEYELNMVAIRGLLRQGPLSRYVRQVSIA